MTEKKYAQYEMIIDTLIIQVKHNVKDAKKIAKAELIKWGISSDMAEKRIQAELFS